MINIDFSAAITLFLFIFVNMLILLWLSDRKQKEKDLFLNPKFIWFCSVCTYTYINTKEDAISICPRCGSYNKKNS
ncbi:MAG: hypothetical protein PHN57_04335 [Candidatus Omnitrophica bacterium]|nr:hypothetical protein [Candidatus Omnitrophota bacterium]